jgi:hypothetical protein
MKSSLEVRLSLLQDSRYIKPLEMAVLLNWQARP